MSLKDKLELEEVNTEKKQENYMVIGMCFGIFAGCIGMSILAISGQTAWGGLSICIGLLGGMIVGMLIPKKNIDEGIVLAPSSHTVEDEFYGADDIEYRISFTVNDAFKEAKSHAGEVNMLNTYTPANEYGKEGTYPYLAIQIDNNVYNAVEEFKETGTFTGAIDLTTLSGKFYFKAKMEYYNYFMYFYGMDLCSGSLENYGLCIVYPKVYAGTENERKLMHVLDEAAESYHEDPKTHV